jgi:hypothetical protein
MFAEHVMPKLAEEDLISAREVCRSSHAADAVQHNRRSF